MAGRTENSQKFLGKIALITGASSGIGCAIAVYFTKLGCKVAITGRSTENLGKTANECQKYMDKNDVLPILGDMSCEADVERTVQTTVKHFGQLDILVNSAGLKARDNILNTSMANYDQLMNTNVRSVFHITSLCIPHLIKTQGCIVNVSSLAGMRASNGILSYSVSKAAIDQFTRCVALELADKQVRVNSVNPGVVNTGFHKRGINPVDQEGLVKFLERCKSTHPLGRIGEAEEVAQLVGFLASKEAAFITGETIPIDGGRHATCP